MFQNHEQETLLVKKQSPQPRGEPIWRCWSFCESLERLTERIPKSVWVELIFVGRKGKKILTA